MFKPGDKLKRNANWQGLKLGNYPTLAAYNVYTVSKYNDAAYPTVSFEETGTTEWDASYFEHDHYVAPDLKIFSYFKCTKLPDYSKDTTVNKIYMIMGGDEDDDLWFFDDAGDQNYAVNYPEDYGIQLVDFDQHESTKQETIAKPILEERKVGKIRMELFDSGFPNAVLEIAKVMTWANLHKGYKDNDWKGIPDAENAFKGAAARHRVKLDAQRSFGEDLLNCVDEESGIIHLAHECFNNLALLELALVGKIK